MDMRSRFLLAAGLMLASIPVAAPAADVRTEAVSYTVDGTEHRGYIAYDAAVEGERPGVLVVHEWWGLNDYARRRARMLAEAGYTAMALDMYGEGAVADHPEDAGAMAGEVRASMERMRDRFTAAASVLRDHALVDGDRIAAIGYCFGGSVVLEMARQGADLAGVASFHGALDTEQPARAGEVGAEVLVLHGAADVFVPAEQVEAFRAEMDAAGVDYEIIEYEGAMHGFTNPAADEAGERFDLPLAYDGTANRESWTALMAFLERTLE